MKTIHSNIIWTSALFLGIMFTAQGQEDPEQVQQSWIAPGGGSFGDAAHWDNAVPGVGELGWFNLGQTGYTVELDANRSVGAIQIANDGVVLNLNGHALTLTDPSSESTASDASDPYWNNSSDAFQGRTALMVGRGVEGAAHNSSLTFSGAGTVTTQGLTIGGTSGSVGSLIIEGAGTTLNVEGDALNEVILGFRGRGELVVRDGAQANLAQVTMVRHAGAVADLRVEGVGSRVDFTFLNVGHRGEGNIYVEDGAELIGGRLDIGARTAGSSMVVDGGTVESGNVVLAYSSSGKGTLEVVNGGTMDVAGSLRVAHQNANNVGDIVIDGAGSRLTVSGAVVLASAGTGSLSVRNGGTFSTSNSITVGENATIAIDGGTITAAQLSGGAGSKLAITLNSGEFDPLLRFTGSSETNIDGIALEVVLGDGFSANLGDVFILADYVSLTGVFDIATDDGGITIGGYVFDLSYGSGDNSTISMSVSAIPEPSTVAVLFAGAALIGVIVLRRSKARY